MARLTPRERRQARTREEILAAALSLINEKGPDQFSLRSLARRVDYSPAGLYEYFDSKEDIVDAVCVEAERRLDVALRAVPDTLPPDRYLVELGLAYIGYAKQNTEHFQLLFTRSPEAPQVPLEALHLSETFKILLGAVERAMDAGLIQKRDQDGVMEVAYSLWAVSLGLAMLQLTSLRNVKYDFEAADRATLEAIVRGFGRQV